MNVSNQTFIQTRWSLEDLYPGPNSPELEAAFPSLENKVQAFEKNRPELNEVMEPQDLMKIVHQLEGINSEAMTLSSYAGLWFTEDTQNQAALALMARIDQFLTELGNRILFFNLWWKSLPDEQAERLMADSGDYRYWLEEMRHFKPHTLTEPEEKVINIKNVTGSNALVTLYDSITNRYVFRVEIEGEIKEVTRGELMVFVRQHDAGLREKAYHELYRVYGQDAPILGQMYQTLVRDWRNEQINLRRYPSPIAARNLANDVPDEVVDTLLNVCQENAGVFQRFFRLKAHWLGMDRLRRYDIYAPVAKSDKSYTFAAAADRVFASFENFDPQFAGLARRVFIDNHLDSEIRKGKESGAFCATVRPDLTPWVKLNYQGRPDDVATMAHELGHAIHSMMAEHHSIFTQHASLPLAETASTFGEMMLVDSLLAEESDENVRRDLLFRQVDDAYATIQRQAFFALFERQAHEMTTQNASVDELAAAYLENLKSQFGDAVGVTDEFRWEWVSVPHIYKTPFYVYAYAFGQLLVLSLYQEYRSEGESFKPRYKQILAAGGSVAPVKLLANAGIDVHQPEFWRGGFRVIEGLIDQLEAIPVRR
ncbi:MAG TPA: M3 family oligoendopeptidase [Anaerolineaceae bacterium]|nr:M3 family oligoendopeptidase [Anaerolineaceae bacterium]